MGSGASNPRHDHECSAASNGRTGRAAATAVRSGEAHGFIAIARIVRPQGRKGEVLAEILTDFPARFANLQKAFLDDSGNGPQAVTVEDAWLHKGKVVIKFAGIDSISDAEKVKGRHVVIPENEKVTLSAHQYYLWELIGCTVAVESQGAKNPIGTVTEIERTGGVDLLHVSDSSGEVLVPFAEAICKVIDPEARLIVIEPPEDLLNLNRE